MTDLSQPFPVPFLTTVGDFAVAFVLGTLIGAERQWRQRSAGLRTTVLVALGAAAFADLGVRLAGPAGSTRVVAYIVSGIGFLGAGVILKEGANIRGINTAGTLWCSAAVGAFCGCGYSAEATLLTVFILAGNTLLRPLVNVWPAPSARGDFHLALISLLQRIRSRASNPAKMEIRAA
ncbi:MgtC/SapB family protein (plasmid) [Acidiphilium multivorum AIU301]|uniref:Protein MgtC n=2 Tax=Acidiphilium multivorum TaxID=62140 RepID=F0J7T7_ACIMA|nr:MgtC/SapB family protein [Acidiphilium multivorum AIU301]